MDFKKDFVKNQVTLQVQRTNKILVFCKIPKSRHENHFEVNIRDMDSAKYISLTDIAKNKLKKQKILLIKD